jgi:hypothetical protein
MTAWDDFVSEMERLPLDADTADRLLAGAVLPEDAPPGYAGVASLLAAARPNGPGSWPAREDAALESFVIAARTSSETTTRSPRRSSLHRLKLAATITTVALACTAGLAFAGSLPGAAQDVASTMLAKVGVTVPGPNEHAGTHPSTRGSSSQEATTTESTSETESTSGKGSEISQFAATTDLTGVEKGAAISTLASGGESQAGQHGQATAGHGSGAEAPSSSGANTADAASAGHSTAGSDNGAAGQAHRP